MTQEVEDLEDKIRLANEAIESLRGTGIELQLSQLPIHAIYKSETYTVALQHTSGNNMANSPSQASFNLLMFYH